MKQFLLVAGLTALSVAQSVPAPSKLQLKVGDEAPDFTLPDNNNKPMKLSDWRSSRPRSPVVERRNSPPTSLVLANSLKQIRRF